MLLIISQSKRIAKSISDTFYYMSILSYEATPHEALSEISEIYRAALIVNPESFPDVRDYVNRVKAYKSDLPVFALTDEGELPYYADIFDKTFAFPTFTPALAEKIIKYANDNSCARIGDYRLAGFNASSDVVGVNYFYRKVNLTKTEMMILRFLIRSYPVPKGADEILKYAFKSSRSPDKNSIRTHISLMNKKFEKYLDKKVLTFIPHRGYIIETPEYKYIAKEM